jgi:dihydrodipicolinate synthase/N-acetylneuraminate lyase
VSGEWVKRLREGAVIPAHPLALTARRKLDERRQRALTRYYLAAGAGGLAVGVHTTQFGIRKAGLLRPVLELAVETPGDARGGQRSLAALGTSPPILIAGICGKTKQAVQEAELAAELKYHAGLVSLSAFPRAPVAELIAHLKAVAKVIPVFGFYLQPAVGGRPLDYGFWRRFAEIEGVVAIKIAPFDRYRTLEVIRAVADSGRAADIALYTGNDDHIILDLVTSLRATRIVGGLLGHWAYWTKRAVEHLERCHHVMKAGLAVPRQLHTLAAQVTDANAAVFDAANRFAGCIPGIHEVLRRHGLLAGRWCLDPGEALSPGQLTEIDRIWKAYPHLRDDDFVQEHLDEWLR